MYNILELLPASFLFGSARTGNLDGSKVLEEWASVFQLWVVLCYSDLNVLKEIKVQLDNCFNVRVFMCEILFNLWRVRTYSLCSGEDDSVYLFKEKLCSVCCLCISYIKC